VQQFRPQLEGLADTALQVATPLQGAEQAKALDVVMPVARASSLKVAPRAVATSSRR
jgi:hypothetical protein